MLFSIIDIRSPLFQHIDHNNSVFTEMPTKNVCPPVDDQLSNSGQMALSLLELLDNDNAPATSSNGIIVTENYCST